MREFAALNNLDLWYLHPNQAEMQARWGKEAKTDNEGIDASFTPVTPG